MSRREKLLFGFFVCLFLVGSVWWGIRIWNNNTVLVPAPGGEFSEAFVGSPRYINPVLADTSEAESAMEALIFSALFKTDTKGGLIPDLAEEYTVSENRREYFVTLKENAKWHDGAPVGVDDILFTLSLIRNPSLRSPLAFAWQGVEFEKISDRTIKFILKEPYEFFLQNLTFRILPQHLWAKIPLENFHLADLNLRPIGSGPYRFRSFERDTAGNIISYTLSANPQYFRARPYIDTLRLRFYKDKESALLAWKKDEVDALGGLESLDAVNGERPNVKRIATTRQFNVFFNTDSPLLADGRVRQALISAIDREKFALEVLGAAGKISASGIPYDPEESKTLLSRAGWKSANENGILTKGSGRRKLTLALELIIPASPLHQRTAEFLKAAWREIGVEVKIAPLDAAAISNVLRARSYDMILFGTLFGVEPDYFPFWHSSQSDYPGLNLSRLELRRLDTILKEIRHNPNPEERNMLRSQALDLIEGSYSVLFLYSPYYFYGISSRISLGEAAPEIIGTPEERFNRIAEWFILTKRAWKR